MTWVTVANTTASNATYVSWRKKDEPPTTTSGVREPRRPILPTLSAAEALPLPTEAD